MSELKSKFKIIKAFKEIVKFNLILKSSYKELFNNDYEKLLKLKDKIKFRIDLFFENKLILNKEDFILGIKKDVIIMFDIFRQGVVDKEIDE